LVLDPRLGEAHAALGLVESHYDYDFPAAQRDFLKAIELNPNYPNAHMFYAGAYLTPMGRYQEAIAEMKKALDLDPLSLPLNSLMGNTYLWAGDYEKSAQQYQHAIELDPTFPMAHFFNANLLAETGKYEQAIEETQQGELRAGVSPQAASAVAAEFQRAFRTGGAKGYWQKNLEATLKQLQEAKAQVLPSFGCRYCICNGGRQGKDPGMASEVICGKRRKPHSRKLLSGVQEYSWRREISRAVATHRAAGLG
jgi:tetratricopeptide (TPR) repeat protein